MLVAVLRQLASGLLAAAAGCSCLFLLLSIDGLLFHDAFLEVLSVDSLGGPLAGSGVVFVRDALLAL